MKTKALRVNLTLIILSSLLVGCYVFGPPSSPETFKELSNPAKGWITINCISGNPRRYWSQTSPDLADAETEFLCKSVRPAVDDFRLIEIVDLSSPLMLAIIGGKDKTTGGEVRGGMLVWISNTQEGPRIFWVYYLGCTDDLPSRRTCGENFENFFWPYEPAK
jgi:hypothetical protein